MGRSRRVQRVSGLEEHLHRGWIARRLTPGRGAHMEGARRLLLGRRGGQADANPGQSLSMRYGRDRASPRYHYGGHSRPAPRRREGVPVGGLARPICSVSVGVLLAMETYGLEEDRAGGTDRKSVV